MKKDYDKKKRRMMYIMAFVIVGVMILSSFAIMLDNSNSSSKQEYNGYTFINTENGWLAKIGDNNVLFVNSPADLESIKINQTVKDLVVGKAHIGLTSDVDDPLASSIALEQFTYAQVLPSTTKAYTTTGFTGNNTYGKPVFGCNASSTTTPVIYFKKSRVPGMTAEGSCIIVSAETDYEMVVMGERLLFYMIGVMKD